MYLCLLVFQQPKKPLSKNNSVDSIFRRDLASVSASDGGLRNGALSPKSAMKVYGDRLTNYEQQELLSYAQIYFVGSAKKSSASYSGENNDGFDDAQNAYIVIAHDHIAYRYEILKSLGKGSFGQVTYSIFRCILDAGTTSMCKLSSNTIVVVC